MHTLNPSILHSAPTMSTPRLLFAVTIAFLTAPTLSRLPDAADSTNPSFSLAATVQPIGASKTLLAENATAVTVARCARLCEQHDALCVGFSWLPRDGALNVSNLVLDVISIWWTKGLRLIIDKKVPKRCKRLDSTP